MATAKQIAANRANARRSTGPRTAAGRAKSSRNSFRHGLSLPLSTDPQLSAMIGLLANAIAGERPTEDQLQAAMVVAEAQLDLKRIHDVQIEAASSVQIATETPDLQSLRSSWALNRYTRRALSRRKFAVRELDHFRENN
jgi:hypothetical protein